MRPTTAIRNFLQLEAAGGILLIAAAALAMLVANSPLDCHYNDLLDVYAEVSIGELGIRKPVLLWINDGLMAIFFLLIGLEVKREIRDGQLSNPRQVVLPGIAALFGLAMPALIYVAFNWGDSEALNGWAIPAATDIAFALGILYLVGSRVPTALKLFLLTVAIFDDLAAIVIIAVFYTADLSLSSLVLAGVTLVVLLIMNLSGVKRTGIYLFVGVLLWVFVLKSGVHATLAGVALAFAIPLKGSTAADHSPLRALEHTLHPWVAGNAAGIVRGQAGRHFRRFLDCDSPGRGTIARGRALGGALWRGGVGWRRIHHEPVHRVARVRAWRRGTVGAGSARHYNRVAPCCLVRF